MTRFYYKEMNLKNYIHIIIFAYSVLKKKIYIVMLYSTDFL